MLLRYSKGIITAVVTSMDKQRKDKKPENSGSFRKFEEMTKNLLAVSNKEAREQEAANKHGHEEQKKRKS